MNVDQRIKGAAEVGAHRTSMLQDLERGRPMEIDAIVGVVSELGRLVEVPTPTIDTVYHLVVRRAREAGCYSG
jgi:2-dehydropantoate 2-reductase